MTLPDEPFAIEDGGERLLAEWRALRSFRSAGDPHAPPLYPEGLLSLAAPEWGAA